MRVGIGMKGIFCKNCGKELKPNQHCCPFCGCNNVLFKEESLSTTVHTRVGCKVRHKRKGFGKFLAEVISGWFPSIDPKLPRGAEKLRIINKERNQYSEVIRDLRTGQIIHETHEPLSQHKHQ